MTLGQVELHYNAHISKEKERYRYDLLIARASQSDDVHFKKFLKMFD